MRLVGFAQARHPELEQLDVVLLRRPKNTQELLRVLFGATVHLGEFEKDLHFAEGNQKHNTQTPQQNHSTVQVPRPEAPRPAHRAAAHGFTPQGLPQARQL